MKIGIFRYFMCHTNIILLYMNFQNKPGITTTPANVRTINKCHVVLQYGDFIINTYSETISAI